MRIGRRDVRLTNLDKVYFPERGLAKGDLVAYYVDAADCVLQHVRRRPMQMKRYPDGVDGFFFYQEAKRLQKEHSSADTGGRGWARNRQPLPLLTSCSTRHPRRSAGAKFGKRRDPIHPFLREVLLRSAVNPLHGSASPLDELLPSATAERERFSGRATERATTPVGSLSTSSGKPSLPISAATTSARPARPRYVAMASTLESSTSCSAGQRALSRTNTTSRS